MGLKGLETEKTPFIPAFPSNLAHLARWTTIALINYHLPYYKKKKKKERKKEKKNKGVIFKCMCIENISILICL
jgi:hypothetical protein